MVAQNMKKVNNILNAMIAVRTLCARRERAVNTLQQLLTRLWRCKDIVYTLLLANLLFYAYFMVTPQRADRFSKRCTNAVTSPFGVTWALGYITY